MMERKRGLASSSKKLAFPSLNCLSVTGGGGKTEWNISPRLLTSIISWELSWMWIWFLLRQIPNPPQVTKRRKLAKLSQAKWLLSFSASRQAQTQILFRHSRNNEALEQEIHNLPLNSLQLCLMLVRFRQVLAPRKQPEKKKMSSTKLPKCENRTFCCNNKLEWLSENFAPIEEEKFAENLEVEGEIPHDLEGEYVRNGLFDYFICNCRTKSQIRGQD